MKCVPLAQWPRWIRARTRQTNGSTEMAAHRMAPMIHLVIAEIKVAVVIQRNIEIQPQATNRRVVAQIMQPTTTTT